MPHRGSEEGRFTLRLLFRYFLILRDELCTVKHYDTLLAEEQMSDLLLKP